MNKDKIVCVEVLTMNNFDSVNPLTLNRIYDMLYESDQWYHIIDDKGVYGGWRKDRFISLERLRDDKLTEILGL